jgi:hypothetical protein
MDNLEVSKWFAQAEDDLAYGSDGVTSTRVVPHGIFTKPLKKRSRRSLLLRVKIFQGRMTCRDY